MRDTAIFYAATLSKFVTVFFKYKIWLYYYEGTKEKGKIYKKSGGSDETWTRNLLRDRQAL